MKPIYLRTARERAGLTQEQLEALSGVPQSTISKLETDPTRSADFTTVLSLADALHIENPRCLRFGPVPARGVKPHELSA